MKGPVDLYTEHAQRAGAYLEHGLQRARTRLYAERGVRATTIDAYEAEIVGVLAVYTAHVQGAGIPEARQLQLLDEARKLAEQVIDARLEVSPT